MPPFGALASSIAEEFGIAAPEVKTSGDAPITIEAVQQLEGLSRAGTQRFGTMMRATQLIAGAKELSNPNIAAPIQARVAGPALTDPAGDVYLFRITEAMPSVPATDLAAVRDTVLADVMSLERFQWLQQNEAALAQQANAEGLRALAEKYGSKVDFATQIRQYEPNFMSAGMRFPSSIPGLEGDSDVIAQLVDKASVLPLTVDLATIPAENRTFVVSSPDSLSLVVMQVSELFPVSRETMTGLIAEPGIARAVRDPADGNLVAEMFTFDALASRLNFKRVRTEGEEDPDAKPEGVAAGEATKSASST